MPFHYHYKCSISTCSTRIPGKIYHSFPRNEILCKIWLERIGERRFIEMDLQKLWTTHKICSRHFHKSCICPSNINALKTYSLPILHLPNCKLEATPENYILSREKFINLVEISILEDQAFILEVEHNYCTMVEENCETSTQTSLILPEKVQPVSVPVLQQAFNILPEKEQPVSLLALKQASKILPEKVQPVSVPVLQQASNILPEKEQPVSVPALKQTSKNIPEKEEPISVPALKQASNILPGKEQPVSLATLKQVSNILPEKEQPVSVPALKQASNILPEKEQLVSVPALKQTSKNISVPEIEQRVSLPVSADISPKIFKLDSDRKLTQSTEAIKRVAKMLARTKPPVAGTKLNDTSISTFALNPLNNCRVQSYNEGESPQIAQEEAVINRNANGYDRRVYFNLTKSDFTNICFICYGLKSQVPLYDMRHSYLQKSTMQSILKKVYEKLPDNTQLPQHLCLSCIKILLQTFKFLQQINAAHEVYDKILVLGKDFHLINECYYRDDLNEIDNLLSLCTIGNNVDLTNSDANCKSHGVDITCASSPNSPNANDSDTDDIVKIYTINSRQRVFDIKDAECTLFLSKRAKGIVKNKSTMLTDCSTQDFTKSKNGELSISPKNCINQFQEQDDIRSAVKKTTLKIVRDKTSISNIQSIDNCNDLLVKDKSNSDGVKSNIEESPESAHLDECTTDYKVILNMELSEEPIAEDYDDSCDVDFDEDIKALDNFKLGEFSPYKMSAIRKYRCKVCSEVFTSVELITNHRKKMRHNRRKRKRISRCRVCNLIFPTSAHLHKHTISHKNIECKICGKTLPKTRLKYHAKTHLSNWYQQKRPIRHRALCTKCGQTFSEKYINLHFPCAGTDVAHKCNECSFVTLFEGHMERHKLKHENEFRCIICNCIMTEKSSLEKHIRRLHTERPYSKMFKCIFCAQEFRLLYDLFKHRKLNHSGQKIKQLHIATKKARKMASMKSQRSHIIGYKCQICDKSFSTKTPFLLHACGIHGYPIDKLQSQETTTFPVPANKAVSAEMQRYHQEFDQQPSTSKTVIQTPTIFVSPHLYTPIERNILLIHPEENTSVSKARNLHLENRNSDDEVILPHSYEASDFGLQMHRCSLCFITFRHKTNLNNHMLYIHGEVSRKR